MSIINTSIGASTDGTYGMPNAIIGQIKNIIQNDTNVEIISDNDPANTTQRILIYSIASQNHHIKIAATASSQITFYLLGIDGSTSLSSQYISISSGTNFYFKFLYNSKSHFWVITNASNSIQCTFWAVNCGDTTYGWYVRAISNSSTGSFYNSLTDNYGYIDRPYYLRIDNDGKFIGIPCRFAVLANYQSEYYLYLFGSVNSLWPAGFYSDGSYNYLSDTYVMLCDRVPS